MKEFAYVAKNMFNFKGRARRREYWISQLINIGIIYAIWGFVFFILGLSLKGLTPNASAAPLFTIVCSLVAIIIMIVVAIWSFLYSLAVTIRRLHDRNLSGWIFLACIAGTMLCGIGSIVLFVLLCLDGTEGENQYGVNPKELPGADDNGSITPAIISPIAGFILFIIGYVSIFVNCIAALGGWEAFINAATQSSTENQYNINDDYNNDYFMKEETEEVVDNDTEENTEAVTNDKKDNIISNSAAPENAVTNTSLTNPAKIGDWIETKAYSAVDGKDHTLYYRITDVVTGAEVDDAIAKYSEDGVWQINELEDDKLEYRLVKYDIYYPTDFPANDWGITLDNISFMITDEGNDGIEYDGMIYIGFDCTDINDSFLDYEINPGDTFTEGKALMVMIKDFDNYLFSHSLYDDDGNETIEYIQGK